MEVYIRQKYQVGEFVASLKDWRRHHVWNEGAKNCNRNPLLNPACTSPPQRVLFSMFSPQKHRSGVLTCQGMGNTQSEVVSKVPRV